MRNTALVAVLLASVVFVAGCGSNSSTAGQIIENGPTSVGTASAELSKTDMLRDVAKARKVVDASETSKAINAVYTVINDAGNEKDVDKGTAMLRRRIPSLVDQFEGDYQLTFNRLRALKFKTQAGERIRQFDIELVGDWHRILPKLRSELAMGESAWGAIVKFGERNNQLSRREKRNLISLVASLPESQRRVLEQAIKQTYGR